MGELTLEHQREKITADRRDALQAVVWFQHNLGRQAQDLAIDGGADYRGNILMLRDERPRHYYIKAWLAAAFGDMLAGAVDFAPSHERVCSATRVLARADKVIR
jgi:hypothetical protein